ncbi:MAG TPA: hypothetical protein VGK67_27725 [Myxococcales bacterium]|jgi:hypothetical protein
MTRPLLALAAACALALPARGLAAEPAKAAAPAAKPAEPAKAVEQPKEAAADPAKSGYDPATMGFGKPPPRVGRLRADSLLSTSMKAAMEAPVGASDCESAYNGIKALFDTMKKMNFEPALRKEMPKREPWVAQCKQQPPEIQKCLVIKYQVEHKSECNKALDDAKAAGKGFDVDDHAGESIPHH